MSTSISTGQPDSASTKGGKMGVASLATKRHLEAPTDGDEVVSAKLAKITQSHNNNNNEESSTRIVNGVVLLENGGDVHNHQHSQIIVQESSATVENSSELVTTSILARTLLTTSSSGSSSLLGVSSQYSGATADPLESLKCSLEALPAPAILDSHSAYLTSSNGNKMTIVQQNGGGREDSLTSFASLLGPERCSPLATAVTTVLSPIDEDPIEWTNPAKATPVMNGISSENHHHHHHHHHGMNPSISSLTSLVDHQLQQQLNGVGSHHHLNGGMSPQHEVITEDENGKSYFNLGSTQDSTILARKSSTSSESGWGGGSSCGGGGGGNGSNNADFDDAISSSSCDSISSEDLFNSGEEFDASDDEDELCTYKQQRSTVLHLSLCKLNKFRTNCVEPSLHRSVLICNTLRHIEQEIRNEDEAADESLKSRERLPSFWPSPSPPSNNNGNNPNNQCFPQPPQSPSQPQITDTRPNSLLMGGGLGGGGPMQGEGGLGQSLVGGGSPAGVMLGGGILSSPSSSPVVVNGGRHDPYLTPYSEAPYLSAYDYNSPRPTPFHTTSYDYEQDLLLPPPPNASPSSTAPSQASQTSSLLGMSDVTSGTGSLMECDSGYSDDLDLSLSSYYYTGPIPPPPVSLPPVAVAPVTSSHQSCVAMSSPSPHLLNGSEHLTTLQPPVTTSSSASTPPMEINEISSAGGGGGASSNNGSCEQYTMASNSNSVITTNSCSSSIESLMDSSFQKDNHHNSHLPHQPNDQSSSTVSNSHSHQSPNNSACSLLSPLTTVTPVTTTASASSASSSPSQSSSPGGNSSNNTFAQQDSQCGLESRRSDLSRNVNHYNNHNLPMDSLISSSYSSSSL